MNQVKISGRVETAPELRQIHDQQFIFVVVRVERDCGDGADHFPVAAYGPTAIEKFSRLQVGSQVAIGGHAALCDYGEDGRVFLEIRPTSLTIGYTPPDIKPYALKAAL